MMSPGERDRLLSVYHAHARRFDAIARQRARAGIRSAPLSQPVRLLSVRPGPDARDARDAE
jgi:hypothetical protein